MVEIKKIEKEGECYRVVLETPRGFARMWITEEEYESGELEEISSNVSDYLRNYKDDIKDQLRKYKQQIEYKNE